ncbi:MAG: DUF72 domain-containing protein [Vulcanimicrobiota bacterium]
MKRQARVRIGTSGWHYDHWIGKFYPDNMKKKNELEFFSEYFDTVEINNSFYQVPSDKTLNNWQKTVPDDFLFAFKANRYTTHMKKLKDPGKSIPTLIHSLKQLAGNLGPILFQLPPNFGFNGERLNNFLKELPEKYNYAFEFRDPDWFRDETYQLLSEYNSAFCIYDMPGMETPREITANWVYIRMHGPEKKYEDRYTNHQLSGWAGALNTWKDQGKDIYCYFNNDKAGYAVENARALKEMLGIKLLK